jgi:hypothetical protein
MNTVNIVSYQHDITYMAEARVWCREKFGNPSFYRTITPGGQQIAPLVCAVRWRYVGHGKFTFAFEYDAIQFALRWA